MIDPLHIARATSTIQNKQVDDYFNKIIEKSIDPFLLSLYREDKIPVPGLESFINDTSNADPNDTYFTRHLKIFLNKIQIGEAIFKAKLNSQGLMECTVEEIIKTSE